MNYEGQICSGALPRDREKMLDRLDASITNASHKDIRLSVQ